MYISSLLYHFSMLFLPICKRKKEKLPLSPFFLSLSLNLFMNKHKHTKNQEHYKKIHHFTAPYIPPPTKKENSILFLHFCNRLFTKLRGQNDWRHDVSFHCDSSLSHRTSECLFGPNCMSWQHRILTRFSGAYGGMITYVTAFWVNLYHRWCYSHFTLLFNWKVIIMRICWYRCARTRGKWF